MCGIAGIVVRPGGSVPTDRLEAMARSLAHRGPDDQGVVAIGQVGLVHRRLSILDTSTNGHQPMSSPDGASWIVFNGEIFNYRELRDRLPADPPYDSGTDTEVLLRALQAWGSEALPHLNGMWAFAALDARNDRLLLARDRYGIKPLYYAQDDAGFYFGSEMKALLAAGFPARLDRLAAVDFPFFGLPLPHRELVKGIRRLPPGCYLDFDLRTFTHQIKTHYEPLPDWDRGASLGTSEPAWIDAIEELLNSSIRYRLISDVPVGTFCSGGVDSSLITAIAARKHPGISLFNVAIPDRPGFDEGPEAGIVARHLGLPLNTLALTRDIFLRAFVYTTYITETPLTLLNTVPLFLVSKLAYEQGVRVLLSGEGADELFGGYVSQIRQNAFDRVLRSQPPMLRALAQQAVRIADAVDRRRSFGPTGADADAGAMHRVLLGHFRAFRERDRGTAIYDRYGDPLDRDLASSLLWQVKNYLVTVLHRADRAAMAASVEARIPFLDYRLVGLALATPPSLKVQTRGFRPVGKALVKKLAERYIPRSIVHRKKRGFEIPPDFYLGTWPERWLHEGFVTSHFEVSPRELAAWLAADKSQTYAWMLSLEIWGQLFIHGRSVADVADEYLRAAGVTPGWSSPDVPPVPSSVLHIPAFGNHAAPL